MAAIASFHSSIKAARFPPASIAQIQQVPCAHLFCSVLLRRIWIKMGCGVSAWVTFVMIHLFFSSAFVYNYRLCIVLLPVYLQRHQLLGLCQWATVTTLVCDNREVSRTACPSLFSKIISLSVFIFSFDRNRMWSQCPGNRCSCLVIKMRSFDLSTLFHREPMRGDESREIGGDWHQGISRIGLVRFHS